MQRIRARAPQPNQGTRGEILRQRSSAMRTREKHPPKRSRATDLWTTVVRLWTTLLACPVAGSDWGVGSGRRVGSDESGVASDGAVAGRDSLIHRLWKSCGQRDRKPAGWRL